jgi:hypothetical protein
MAGRQGSERGEVARKRARAFMVRTAMVSQKLANVSSGRYRQVDVMRTLARARPHRVADDLPRRRRRTEQIQFLLGHISAQMTERYLGCAQHISSGRKPQDRNRAPHLGKSSRQIRSAFPSLGINQDVVVYRDHRCAGNEGRQRRWGSRVSGGQSCCPSSTPSNAGIEAKDVS